MKLYVVRHGESENNLKKLYTGWFDAHLTDEGIDQARRAGTLIEGINFDRVFSSDLLRAVATAKAVLPDRVPELTPLLREISVGRLENISVSSLTDDEMLETRTLGYGSFGGESKEDIQARVRSFLKMLEEDACRCAIAFSHAGWLRTVFELTVGVSFPRGSLVLNNCAVAVLDFDGEVWRLHSWLNLP